MRELFLIAALFGASLNIFPRYDGVVMEITGDSRLEPALQAWETTVRVDIDEPVLGGEHLHLPIWMDHLALDSCGLTAVFDPRIVSLDWALNGDSTVMLLFASSDEPLELPSVAWQGPPPRPPVSEVPDSLIFQAFESGGVSPWLSTFDCVVIDPGHGGRDPGAVGPSGTYEKDRVLEISLLVRDLLRIRMPELNVVLTRTDDRYVSLGARTRMANASRADLFISIHCNAAENRDAHGFETFFLSRARTDDARAVEMLENNAIQLDETPAVPDDPLSFLLADMAQSVFQNRSSLLAGTVQSKFRSSFPARRDRGVKRAGFYVLRGAYMPAVLVEVAFISNPTEEGSLLSLDFRFRAAEAIVESIMEYAEREAD